MVKEDIPTEKQVHYQEEIPRKEEEICKLRKEGFNLHEIAKKVNVSTTTISEVLKRNGFEVYSGVRPKGTWERREHGTVHCDESEVLRLRHKGLSIKAICRELKLYQDLVSPILDKHNISSVKWLNNKKRELGYSCSKKL